MYMYDTHLGDMEVEIQIAPEVRDSRIVYGYQLDTFKELTDEDLEYLNDKYAEDIIMQVEDVLLGKDPDAIKLYN